MRFPRGNRQSSWQSHQERLGITSAIQWKPSENIEFTLDIMHGEFTGERDEIHLASRGGNSSSWLGGGTTVDGVTYPHSTINEIRYNVGGDVIYLDVSGGNHASETRRQLAENVFDQYLLTTNWRINDDLKAQFLIGTETSNFDVPISDKFCLETFGDVISDYTQDRYYLSGPRGRFSSTPAIGKRTTISCDRISNPARSTTIPPATPKFFETTGPRTGPSSISMRLWTRSASRVTPVIFAVSTMSKKRPMPPT